MRNDTRYSQFEDISAGFLGRLTGVGPAIELTTAEATSLLDNFTTTEKGLVPFSGGGTTNFLRADGTWAAPPGSGGVTDGDKGDITVTGSGATWTIDNGVVTFTKIQNSAAGLSVIGRGTNTAGVFSELTAGTDGFILRRSGTTLAFGTISTAGIGDGQVTFAKIQNLTAARLLGRYTASTGVVQEITIGSGLSLDSGTGVLSSTGVSDGDKGDITLTSSATVWTIDLGINKAWSGTHSFEDNDFRLFNPANTFSYNLRTSAIAANRDVTLPLLTGNDTLVLNDFAATLTNKTLGTGTVFSVIPTISDGIKFTFNPDATVSGINVGAHTGDPSAPVDGDIYYNSSATELRARIGGAWIALGASGGTVSGSGTAGQVAYWTAGSIIASEAGFEYDSTNNRLLVPAIRGGVTTLTLASNNGTGTVMTLTDTGDLTGTSTTLSLTTGSSNIAAATGAIGIYSASVDIGSLSSNFMNYTAASNRLRFYRTAASVVTHTIDVTSGDVTTNDGDNISILGGTAYSVSGNGNGGTITLTSGQRRTAGSGVDGSIFLNPRNGTVNINSTDTTVGTGQLTVRGKGFSTGVTMLLQDSTGTAIFRVTDEGNLALGNTSTFGGGRGMLTITNHTLTPSTSPANAVMIYANDWESSSELYVKVESGPSINISGLLTPGIETTTSLLLSDLYRARFIYFTNSSPITVTIPNSLPTGFNVILMQDGTGTISVVGSGGTTINGKTATTGQFDTISLVHYKNTDVYFGK